MLVKECRQQVRVVPQPVTVTAGERKIVPVNTKEFRYLRFKAIGAMEDKLAGFNGNWDGFGYEDFEDERPGYGYKSFIGKRAHYEHNSAAGLSGSIGDLPDAYLNRFTYPDSLPEKRWKSLAGKDATNKRVAILEMPNQKDGSIEVLMRIDTTLMKKADMERKTKDALDRILRMIDTGQTLTCSMGTNCGYSVCSACGNVARFAHDYCDHLKHRKGALTIVAANELRDLLDKDLIRQEWLNHIVASKFDADEIIKGSSNKGIAVRNGEINHDLSFFELSVVAVPAYPRATMLEKLARAKKSSNKEFLKEIAAQFGEDAILDLYSFLQEEGKISSQCKVE